MGKALCSIVWQLAVGIGVLLEVSVVGSWTAGSLHTSWTHVLLDAVVIAFVTCVVAFPAWLVSGGRRGTA